MPARKRSKLPLFLGLGVAALVALGVVALLFAGRDDGERVVLDTETDQEFAFGQEIEGTLDDGETADYEFEGKEDEEVTITVEADDQEELDTIVVLNDEDNDELEENDDIEGTANKNSRITTDLPEDGTYEVEVSAYAGAGDFEVTIELDER